jgi:hypothetical protein
MKIFFMLSSEPVEKTGSILETFINVSEPLEPLKPLLQSYKLSAKPSSLRSFMPRCTSRLVPRFWYVETRSQELFRKVR